jgi:hypothetical protein
LCAAFPPISTITRRCRDSLVALDDIAIGGHLDSIERRRAPRCGAATPGASSVWLSDWLAVARKRVAPRPPPPAENGQICGSLPMLRVGSRFRFLQVSPFGLMVRRRWRAAYSVTTSMDSAGGSNSRSRTSALLLCCREKHHGLCAEVVRLLHELVQLDLALEHRVNSLVHHPPWVTGTSGVSSCPIAGRDPSRRLKLACGALEQSTS